MEDTNTPVLIKLISDKATTQIKSAPESIGIDIYSVSTKNITIPRHGGTKSVHTDLAMNHHQVL